MSHAPSLRALLNSQRHRVKYEFVSQPSTVLDRPLFLHGAVSPDVVLAGHLNFVRPTIIQVIGLIEINYLYQQEEKQREKLLRRLAHTDPIAIVLTEDCLPPPWLVNFANENDIALVRVSENTQQIIAILQQELRRHAASQSLIHGVFIEVMGLGVLLTGAPGIGKSELALELVSRGHRLIADDAPHLTKIAPDVIEGSCPSAIRDFMEVRGLGIVNVRALFGEGAVRPRRTLKLIIHLEPLREQAPSPEQRLQGIHRHREILGVKIPEVVLPVAAGHNLAVIVECTVRSHLLKMDGYEAVGELVQRQRDLIEESTSDEEDESAQQNQQDDIELTRDLSFLRNQNKPQ